MIGDQFDFAFFTIIGMAIGVILTVTVFAPDITLNQETANEILSTQIFGRFIPQENTVARSH